MIFFYVLSLISVFEILLRVSEGNPWKETLLEVLPQRKFKPRAEARKNRAKQAEAEAAEIADEAIDDDGNNGDAKPQADRKNDDFVEE